MIAWLGFVLVEGTDARGKGKHLLHRWLVPGAAITCCSRTHHDPRASRITTFKPWQVEGYAAVKNVRGVAFLNIIGVDAGDLTRNIIILDCLYAGLLLVAMLVLWLRLPTTASMARVSRR